MKKIFILCIFVAFSTACNDPHRDFCTKASEHLCGKCEQCGGDYAMCGLLRTNDKAQCVSELQEICSAYDNVYTRETASICLEQIANLRSCEQFKQSGKPEICSKLF